MGAALLSLSKEREPFVNGAEGCVRETRKGVLHDDYPHFSELLEALKNAPAWRKDFSPRKRVSRRLCRRDTLFQRNSRKA